MKRVISNFIICHIKARVLTKFQASSTKFQIDSNIKIPNLKQENFCHLGIGIWSLFGIWNLRFGILISYITLSILITCTCGCLKSPTEPTAVPKYNVFAKLNATRVNQQIIIDKVYSVD